MEREYVERECRQIGLAHNAPTALERLCEYPGEMLIPISFKAGEPKHKEIPPSVLFEIAYTYETRLIRTRPYIIS